ncbi:hypothetical protein MSAN_01517600 [Mycena sanguinolenta]|uniref:Protein kinase domain-containing protein n=1 Tax=Mycena sanguinolenta TaxID=230812 RepID=A0A8H6Y6X1_9AGAR|nr:hypothetical protein MSAN_01517600 [Mycena sanguinolenta]
MNLQPHSKPESTVVSTTNNAFAGTFFPQATAFNISGGIFTSNVYNSPPEQPSGDIKLIKEFKEMRSSPQSSLVGRRAPGASVRRVYMAKLEGRQSGHMTVAMYEGDGAEEAWNQHLAKYEAIRHPNIMQLYGLVSNRRLRGMVFHDELIPYGQFLRRFQHSPILSAYIVGYCEATGYISNVFPKFPIDYDDLPVWIRPSTGELCLDLVQGGQTSFKLPWWEADVPRLENVSLDAPDSEDMIISSLSEDQYHKLCFRVPIAQFRWFQVSTELPVGLGVFRRDPHRGTCVRITEPLVLPDGDRHWHNYEGAPGEVLTTSWIRYDSRCALQLESHLLFSSYEIPTAWLAQANSIFAELQEFEHVEEYVCVEEVRFTLRITADRDIPDGYLFVCPFQDFRTGTEPHATVYQWPACPAYWSLDPSGADRLSTEDAKILGFPPNSHRNSRDWEVLGSQRL